jgi:hypothetical protein
MFRYTHLVRRLLAISLLMLFSVSLISPLFASDVVQASLPACCRRAGNHHCAEYDGALQHNNGVGITEKCPYIPAGAAVLHLSIFEPPTSGAVFAGLVSHPAIHAQTATQHRVSFDRSRQKRGPPSLILL